MCKTEVEVHRTPRKGFGTHHFEFGLDFTQLAARQHLDVRTDLFPRPCLAGAQFYVPGDQFVASCNTNTTPDAVSW